MLAAVVAVVAFHVVAADPSPGPCTNPRAAAATILSNLRDDHRDLAKATRCVEPQGTTRTEREKALVTLKSALDAVGARVRIDELSDAPGYLDPQTFEPIIAMSKDLPAVRLERMDDGQWMIPHEVIERADEIYDAAVAIDLHKLKKSFPPWAQRAWFGLAAWQLIALLLLVVVGLVIRFALVRLLVWRSSSVLGAFNITATKESLTLAARPLGTLALAGIVSLGIPSLALSGRVSFVALLLVHMLAALAALAFAYRVVDVAADHLVRKAAVTTSKMDDHLVPLVRRILKLVVISLAIVFVLQAFDVNVGSLVAGLGIGGLAVALAAKDTIGNFFGSIAIFLDRPFQIGDWVELNDHDVEGTVEHVGFRSTQVRTIKDTVVSVPNARLADANVDNYGARRARRVRVTAALELSTAPEQAEAFCDGVRAIISAHPHARNDDVEVHLNDFSEYAMTVMIHFYVVRPTWSAELRARHEILLDIVRLARDLGVHFAYPTRTLSLARDVDAKRPSSDDLLAVIREYGPGGKHAKPPGPRILPPPPTEPMPAPQSVDGPPRQP